MRIPICFGVLAVLAFVAGTAAAQDTKPEVRAKLEGHRGGVTALAFAPGRELIATGSGNGVVRLWDTKTGEAVTKLDPVGGTRIVHVGFSADSKVFSAAGRKHVLAWDVTELAKPRQLFADQYGESPYKVGGVSGDGRRVYFFDADNSALRYHDVRNVIVNDTDFKAAKFTPRAFATAPEGDTALAVIFGTSGDKKTSALVFVGLGDTWQLTEGLKVPGTGNSVGFAPDGKWLVVCSGGSALVWKVPGSQKVSGRGREIGVFGTIATAAAGPGNLLAVAEPTENRKVRIHLLDLAADDPKPLGAYLADIEEVSGLAFASDGKTLAVADNVEGVVQLWTLPAKK